MQRLTELPILICCTALLLGCDDSGVAPSSQEVTEHERLGFMSASSTCAFWGDGVKEEDFTLLSGGCLAPGSGFDDQTDTFQYEFPPAHRLENAEDPGQYVLGTVEYRFSSDVDYGIRLADAAFYDSAAGYDSIDGIATSGEFEMRYIRELAGSRFIGYIAKCSLPPGSEADCWEDAVASGDGHYHLEPVYCIDNPDDSTFAAGSDLCQPSGQETALQSDNKLPTAKFTAYQDSANSTCSFWSLNAGTSEDPESSTSSMSYSWEIGDQPEKSGLTTSVSFCDDPGTYPARLLVDDTDGGLDVDLQYLEVQFETPDSLEVTLGGPDQVPANTVCNWTTSDPPVGGLSPYQFTWTRKPVRTLQSAVIVSDSSTYSGDTGTADFHLEVEVESADGQVASDAIVVDVGSAPSCPAFW